MSRLSETLIEVEDSHKASVLSCSLLLANGAIGITSQSSYLYIGAGILTLSLAVSKLGWGLSLGLYIFFGCTLILYIYYKI